MRRHFGSDAADLCARDGNFKAHSQRRCKGQAVAEVSAARYCFATNLRWIKQVQESGNLGWETAKWRA
jgi:hypothetical protein